jgi:hypothetical protein
VNININDGERYIPSLFGNDKDEKPMAFNLKFLTVEEEDAADYYEVMKVKSDRVNMKTNYKDAFLRGVESIENCSVNGKEVKTAQEFLMIRGAPSMTAFMKDVALRIEKGAEISEKN